MSLTNTPAQAAEQDPLSDDYINRLVREHGYDSTEVVIARLWQWIGLNGGENSVTLLMYEAHKALSKLRAPVADEPAFYINPKIIDDRTGKIASHVTGALTWDSKQGRGWSMPVYLSPRLASAPVADERAITSPTAQAFAQLAKQYPVRPASEAQHSDDVAVDRFAVAMKAKLAEKREQGYGGWDDKTECSAEFLSELLRSHVEKGDPLDVGNFAMMLHQRGERIAALASAPVADERAATPGPWQAERPRNRSALIVWRWCQSGSASMRREYLRADGKIASTPGRFRSLNEAHAAIDRAALASAPVAGEAQSEVAKLAEELGDLASDMAYEANQEMDQEKASRAALIERGERALRRFADAAPQASEAVRKQDAEPIAWESTTPVYFKFITDARYRKFSPAVRKWYRPYRCASCAALSAQPATTQLSGNSGALPAQPGASNSDGDDTWKPQTPQQIAAGMRTLARSEGFDWPEPDSAQPGAQKGGSDE